MYTILINDDKSLTTSVKTTLLRNTTTDEIAFLLSPVSLIEDDTDGQQHNPQVTVETTYTALLRYENGNVMKTEALTTDTEFYKGKVRFILPRGAAFFSSKGMVQLWLDLTIETITTTTTYDPETGEIIDETSETKTDTYSTLSTTLFIESSIREKYCPKDDNNTIRITRGDSLTVNITLTDDEGFPYTPVEGDQVWFRVKKNAKADVILIEKSINIDDLILELVEADTEDLAFGNYVYEIEVITIDLDHYTVIKNAPFIITEELH